MLVFAAPIALAQSDPFDLPGTQPGDLANELRTSEVCRSCHGGYGPDAPFDTWAGSMMANAARDPVFQAALAIAEQDRPGAGDLCLRCHTPLGWLGGRSEPSDGSALVESDYDSVTCDFCHRLEPDGPRIGNGQYTVADDFVRRGTIETTLAPHEVAVSAYVGDSALCGLCHDVSNPAEGNFAIERTYTEWLASDFASEGQTCQSCHLPGVPGVLAGSPGLPERVVPRHDLVGGNTWVPRALAVLYPELDRQASYEATALRATAMLQGAARLAVLLPDEGTAGEALGFEVQVVNLAGHKLPTGYPEGRRMWLQVVVRDATGAVLLDSGSYDVELASLPEDPQLREYGVRLAADGVEGFHFILQDEKLADTRIPPRGFLPAADTRPVGRDYVELSDGTLANWDIAPYALEVPTDAAGPLVVEVALWYQSISAEYVRFLRDENRTDDRGRVLYDVWEAADRAPPERLAGWQGELLVRPADPPPPPPPPPPDPVPAASAKGCGHLPPSSPTSFSLALLAALAGRAVRRRDRSGVATEAVRR